MRESMGYEGSGERAKQENQKAREELKAKMEELNQRALKGEIVDKEVLALKKRMDMLTEDARRIESAGMV